MLVPHRTRALATSGWCLLVVGVACSLCVRDPIGSLVSLLAPDTPAGRPGSRQAKLLVALCCLTRRLTACEVGRLVGELGWPWTWRARPALEGPPRPARPPALHASRGEVTALSLCLPLEPWSVGHVCRAVNCSACRGRARPGTRNFFFFAVRLLFVAPHKKNKDRSHLQINNTTKTLSN